MVYATNARFDGQQLTLGRVVLVFATVPAYQDAEVALLKAFPAVVESIERSPDPVAEEIKFRVIATGKLISSRDLDGYKSDPFGFVSHTVESILHAEPRTWTFPPRV